MTPEEYDRIKQAEKEHLRKLKKLKEAHRQLERQSKLTKAITDMTSSMQDKLDVHADMMSKIATESAINEARLEMAIESRPEADDETQALQDELDLTKEKAKELIRRLKAQDDLTSSMSAGSDSGATGGHEGTKTARGSETATDRDDAKNAREKKHRSAADDDLPEKTIGRMKP